MKIAVLLSTYNGSAFLSQQLDSLFGQTYNKLDVFVRDDGSVDDSLSILSGYPVHLLPGTQNLGSKSSFAVLLAHAFENSNADYFMFCDQDDVWYEGKVEKSLKKIQAMEAQYGCIPLLVHTDLEVVDSSLTTVAASMWRYEYILPNKNSFSRLLIQNTITGCTIIINRKLAEKCLAIPGQAIMHDWWLGLVASCFGKIGFINEATIKYRQHGSNTIGAKQFKVGFSVHLLGLLKALTFRHGSSLDGLDVNIRQAESFLEVFEGELDLETKTILADFMALSERSFLQRRVILLKYNLLKQGFIRNVNFLLRI